MCDLLGFSEPSNSQRRDTSTNVYEAGLYSGRAGSNGKGVVCFSSAALICAAVLMALLAGAVVFVLYKAWRKSALNFY